jgi:hypothetical protein
MAKRQAEAGNDRRAGIDDKIETFAEDLGRLLGTAQAKAQGWLGQRQQISKTLEGIRDTATGLLSELGDQVQGLTRRGRGRRRGRPPGVSRMARPAPASSGRRKRRKMSAAARKAISDAQKARWARQRAAAKK